MIIDEKVLMYSPPPPYPASSHPSSPGLSVFTAVNLSTNGRPTLSSLPPHILLEIIYNTFPRDAANLTATSSTLRSSQTHYRGGSGSGGGSRYNDHYDPRLYEESKPEMQRKTLYWLSTCLRLVSRQLYTACMHVLRSTYLPSYQALIRPPYSSDPFPLGVSIAIGSDSAHPPSYSSSDSQNPRASPSPIHTLQRETPVLDRFIAIKVRQDVFSDDTELHIEREDAYRDIFDVAQPRARLEDLVRMYGLREGVISVPGHRTLGCREGASCNKSNNSSLVSLQTLPGSPVSPTSPSAAPKARKSIFSFKKSSPPPSSIPSQSQPSPRPQIQPIAFSQISASFSPRKVGLMYNRSRTIVELPRATTAVERKTETLEVLAKDMVRELRASLEGR